MRSDTPQVRHLHDAPNGPTWTQTSVTSAQAVAAYCDAVAVNNRLTSPPPLFPCAGTYLAIRDAVDDTVDALGTTPDLMIAGRPARSAVQVGVDITLGPGRPHVGDELRAQLGVAHLAADSKGTWLTLRLRSAIGSTPVATGDMTFLLSPAAAPVPQRPRPATPIPAPGAHLADVVRATTPDQAWRYAAASGDTNLVHLDDDVAQSFGLPRAVLHGLCTLAMVVDAASAAAPGPVRRVAVRFGRPAVPGDDLAIRLCRAHGDTSPAIHRLRFSVRTSRGIHMKRGLIEIDPQP
jgi:acyl dehydratase